jgi:RHS repeat-associated protein
MTGYGSLLTASYRGDGLRGWKSGASGTTYFVYDGATPLLEMTASGTVTAVNTFGANGLLSRREGSASTFYTFDPQGSVAQRLNASATVLTSHLFDAFGMWAVSAPVGPFGYGGQSGYYTDSETGLCLLTNRYYDAGTGRFVTRDPIGYAGGMNLYGYVGNGPLTDADPSGLCSSGGILAGIHGWFKGLAGVLFPPAQLQEGTHTLGNVPFDPSGTGLGMERQRALSDAGAAASDYITDLEAQGLEQAALAGAGAAAGRMARAAGGGAGGGSTALAETEEVQRAMSNAELRATESTGLVRGGRGGLHYVSDAVNSDALRARQRLALPQTPEVRVTLRVPKGAFSAPSRVQPKFGLPGGGTERVGFGPVPVQVIGVHPY